MNRLAVLFATVLLPGCLCSEPPTLQGRVVDPWNHPVEGVKVTMAGVGGENVTNDKGMFTLPLQLGKHRLKGDKTGFISASREVEVKDENASELRSLTIIPEPTTDGYHLVGPESFVQLEAQAVVRLGNEIQAFQGIRSSGDIEIDGAQARAVYHTQLKMDQVARLDIELHRLTFVKDMEVATVEGPTRVDLNLWTDAGKVEFQREELGSDDNYVFRMDSLPSGTYAFVSMNLLDPQNVAFASLPEDLRRVHPFSVK